MRSMCYFSSNSFQDKSGSAWLGFFSSCFFEARSSGDDANLLPSRADSWADRIFRADPSPPAKSATECSAADSRDRPPGVTWFGSTHPGAVDSCSGALPSPPDHSADSVSTLSVESADYSTSWTSHAKSFRGRSSERSTPELGEQLSTGGFVQLLPRS